MTSRHEKTRPETAVLALAAMVSVACGEEGMNAGQRLRPNGVSPRSAVASTAPPATVAATAEARPALSTRVDGTLSAPDSAQLIASDSTGRALLQIGAWVEKKEPARAGGMRRVVRSSTRYLAILDPKQQCLEETLSTESLDRAMSVGTPAEALEVLGSREAADEIAHLGRVLREFGIGAAASVALTERDDTVIIEANGHLYRRRGDEPPVVLPVGVATRATPSPARTRIAFAQCGSPCGGFYAPAIFDPASGKVARYPLGDVHDLHWSSDGKTLYFSYDDRSLSRRRATKVCLGRLDLDSKAAVPVRCFESNVISQEISATSPSGGYVGLQLLAEESRSRAFVILRLPSGEESFRVAADPVYPALDDGGRTVWSDNDTPEFHHRVLVNSASGERVFADAQSVGFLKDGAVLVMPSDRPSNDVTPIRSLAERHCGFFEKRQ